VIDTDRVSVTTLVAVDPASAFEVFTEEVDLWWRRDRRYRMPTDRRMAFESGPGGRLVAYQESGDVHEIGVVLAWEPPKRLVFEWRARNFEGDESTQVEVLFEETERGTRVTLEHRGFDALRTDHPVRHGLAGEAFVNLFGIWWGDLLVSLRAHAAHRAEAAKTI
jgi:uncharacterized protein YndB with AHSA1/START domain